MRCLFQIAHEENIKYAAYGWDADSWNGVSNGYPFDPNRDEIMINLKLTQYPGGEVNNRKD